MRDIEGGEFNPKTVPLSLHSYRQQDLSGDRMRTLISKARSVVIVAVFTVLLGACAKRANEESQPYAARLELPKVANIQSERRQDASNHNTLAYEHHLQIEIDKALLAARIEAVKAACVADKETGCTLLEISNQNSEDVPQGSIKVRIAPAGVDTLAKLAGEGGRVAHRQTTAEDLAQPIADTERQLALLNLHRERLTEFMRRKDISVSDLITVSRELAGVQSQLDSFGSQHANLRRRVDTELLTITWTPPPETYRSAQSPVLDALKSFGANFKEAISQVITFLAYVLPWLLIAIPAVVLLRGAWRRGGAWWARRGAKA
jgi:hypothetical protein